MPAPFLASGSDGPLASSSVGVVIAIVVVVLVVVVGGALIWRRRRPDLPDEHDRPVVHEPAPMTGLETALDGVMDRAGRPLREHLDAEAPSVDELRLPDDTGPLLRRALDRLEGTESGTDTGTDTSTTTDPADSGAGDEPTAEPGDGSTERRDDTEPTG